MRCPMCQNNDMKELRIEGYTSLKHNFLKKGYKAWTVHISFTCLECHAYTSCSYMTETDPTDSINRFHKEK